MDSLPKNQAAPEGLSRYTTRPPKAQEFEMFGIPKSTSNTCEVVITVHETSPSLSRLSSPPKAYLPKIKTSGLTPSQSPATIPAVVVSTDRSRSKTPPSLLPPPPSRSLAASTRSQTSSSSHVRSSSAPSMEVQSPVMRSMFPRYNPLVPLAKQHYYPSRESSSRMANVRPGPEASSSRTMSVSSREETQSQDHLRPSVGSLGGLLTSGRDSLQPSHSSEPRPPLSSPEELLDLWSIANGQGNWEVATTYTLRLSWYVHFHGNWEASELIDVFESSDLAPNREVITLNSSSSQILYMLDAEDQNLTISRSHPINPTTTIQVSALTITEPTSTNPLMATVFPKLAELMALDQSSSIAVNHRLNRETNADLQTEALARAYQREATSLFWDTDSQKFYLIHPTLSGGNECTFSIESSPDQIRILSPDHAQQAPIITLSLKSLTLTLNTQLLSHLPSLYIVDTLLATVLILLLHIHRSSSPFTSPLTNASLTPPPSFPPPPPSSSLQPLVSPSSKKAPHKKRRWMTFSPFTRSHSQSKSKSKSKSDRVSSAQLEEQASTDAPTTIEQQQHPSINNNNNTTTTPDPFSLPPPPSAPLQIFDPKDESLPRTTRAVLKLLYWAFSVLVWALSVAVQILAAGIVGLGKLVKKL